MVPLDGEVREGVGLLGSPSFEIPRSVERDKQLDVENADELRRRLPPRTCTTPSPWRCSCWCGGSCSSSSPSLYLAAVDLWTSLGALAFALATVGVFVFTVVYYVLVERLIRPLMALRPQGCSIYDRTFWWHERFWKMSPVTYLTALQRHPAQDRALAAAGCADRPPGLRRRLRPDRADVHHHRRRLHAQRGQHYPAPLAGGRRFQVRPHRDRCRLHARRRRVGPLRRRRWATARCSAPTPSS